MTRFCQSHKIENLQAGYLTNSFCIFEMIADNNAVFRVLADRVDVLDAEPAGTTASSTTGSKFDIELNVRALGQLASGCLNLNEAALRNDVTINSNEEMLKTVFTEKNILVTESF